MTVPVMHAQAINTLIEYTLGLDPDRTGVPTASAAREAAMELASRAHKALAAGLTAADVAAAWPEGADPIARRGGLVEGHCPMGCGPTLRYRISYSRVICISPACPRHTAVAELLADTETDHVVHCTEDGWTVRHPLRERLDDALLTCQVNEICDGLPEGSLGDYRATRDNEGGWVLTPIGGQS